MNKVFLEVFVVFILEAIHSLDHILLWFGIKFFRGDAIIPASSLDDVVVTHGILHILPLIVLTYLVIFRPNLGK